MIRAVPVADVTALPPESEALLRITAAAQVYGDDWKALRFWRGDGGSVLSVADGVATLHPGADAEDAVLFLQMNPDVRTVHTDADTAERLAAAWGTTAETGDVMRAARPITPTGAVSDHPLAALYPLLREVFGAAIPPFDVWYADAHHRFRRGRFRAAAATREGRVVSCALLTAQSDHVSLLGGVATLPAFRGQGLASACVTALAHAEQAAGRDVWITPKHEPAAALYRRLGFVVCGRWGVVCKK